MNHIKTKCAIILQSLVRRFLAINLMNKLRQEKGLKPLFIPTSEYDDTGSNKLVLTRPYTEQREKIIQGKKDVIITAQALAAIVTLQCFIRVLNANQRVSVTLDSLVENENVDAAAVIQSWYRQLLPKRKLILLQIIAKRKNYTAIIRIQTTVRKFLARVEYCELLKRNEIEASIILQCFARMMIANQKALSLLDELLDKEEEEAVIILQRWIHEKLTRRKVLIVPDKCNNLVSFENHKLSPTQKERYSFDDDWSSIGSNTTKSIVRSIAKGNLIEKNNKIIGSITKVQLDSKKIPQSLFRVDKPKESNIFYYNKKPEALVKLQCFARILAARKKARLLLNEMTEREKQEAAIVLQCSIRQYRSRQKLSFISRVVISNQNYAAIRIQAVVRDYLAQEKYLNKFAAKRCLSAKTIRPERKSNLVLKKQDITRKCDQPKGESIQNRMLQQPKELQREKKSEAPNPNELSKMKQENLEKTKQHNYSIWCIVDGGMCCTKGSLSELDG